MAVRFQVSEMEEMTIWEQYTVTIHKDPRRGFGFAVSGGRDHPSKSDGDNSVIVSDVVRGGPADGRLQTRDRIVMVNGASMENVASSFAIHTLKACSKVANVTVKRPRKIQIPASNSVPTASTGPTYSTRTPRSSDGPYWEGSRTGETEEPDSPLPWRGRYESSNREPPEDTARGYEGDSSSGRSSGGSFRPSSHHSRHRRTRGTGSEAGSYPRKRGSGRDVAGSGSEAASYRQRRDRESERGGSGSEAASYSRMRENESEVGNSGSEAGNRNHNGLQLVSGFKRLPPQNAPAKPVKTVLVKRMDKQEYGLKLGSQIFIKHITETGLAAQERSLQEGDLILKINGVVSENMSLGDTRQLIEKSKGKLTLTVLRDNRQFLVNIPEVMDSESEDRSSPREDISDLDSDHSPPPSQPPPPPPGHQRTSSESSEIPLESPPINGETLSESPKPQNGHVESPQLTEEYREEPVRPNEGERRDRAGYSPDARLIQFTKSSNVGLRLAGGNDVGIFVAGVQEGSPASREGMKEGDQILQVNDTSFHSMTREDAASYLMNLPQHEEVIFLTQRKEDIYRKMIKSNVGDSFYIRTHFDYQADSPSGLSFARGDIFHVVDTLYRGKMGSWLASRVDKDLQEVKKGIIPNRTRAEQYASLEPVLKSQSSSGPRAEFWKMRGLRGAKKLLKKSREDLSAITTKAKYPPYERVVLREASFKRPVVILGPITDIAHQKLCAQLPDEFESADSVARDDGSSKVIKLQVVKEIAAKNKHALLDITPTAVEHLNYVQFYPIVVFCNPENRQGVKAMRQWLLPESKKSSRRLYSQAVKMRKNSSRLFTATINLSGASDSWLPSLKEIIRTEQARAIWTAEEKVDSLDTEPLHIQNVSNYGSTDYLSCDSRANSDYEETDAEGGAYTDQEFDEELQEPALARSSEPVVDQQPLYYRSNAESEYSSGYPHSPAATASYHEDNSVIESNFQYRSNETARNTESPQEEDQPRGQWNYKNSSSREYEHDALRRKFNRARSSSSEDDDYNWGGPATDL
ncbi:tight junction ZO-3 isoform X1 [Pelobates cultripes]|uniref:Tight junction ZO-3 isoform X1 n=2 Tax=Pelobates cultripes TaxID=61616 RepID=A0AAD1W3K8_PELCU|nr:tight junction ZO-3 isoform X1 [Pelobates cultripes]